jgi:hypothetical protein
LYGELKGQLTFDSLEDEAEMTYDSLHFFDPYHHQRGDEWYDVTALALEYTGMDGTLSRLGVVESLPEESFDYLDDIKVRIVSDEVGRRRWFKVRHH